MVLIDVAMFVMNDLLTCEQWHNKCNQGHGKHGVSGPIHPLLHMDRWVTLALRQPVHTHAACEEEDRQHWRVIYCDRCLHESLTDCVMFEVRAHEIGDCAADGDRCVDTHILDCQIDNALNRGRH